jgi:hypothetical protein
VTGDPDRLDDLDRKVTTMADLTPEAKQRARGAIAAAGIFAAHADEIAEAVGRLPAKHVLVAVVDADHEFRGAHQVDETELIDRVTELEGPGGWAMVFSSGAEPGHVRNRTSAWASIAQKRIDAIERITARQARGSPDRRLSP